MKRSYKNSVIETKFIDVAEATYACDTTGSITLLNGVATGDDYTNREGRRVTLKSVSIIGKIVPQDTTVTPCHARVMLIFDRQANGALPSITDVLVAATSNSFENRNNIARFQVLWDKSFALASVNDTATQALAGSPTVALVDHNVGLNHNVIFSGTGATVASISTGSLFLLTIGDVASGSAYNFVGATRVLFIDP